MVLSPGYAFMNISSTMITGILLGLECTPFFFFCCSKATQGLVGSNASESQIFFMKMTEIVYAAPHCALDWVSLQDYMPVTFEVKS